MKEEEFVDIIEDAKALTRVKISNLRCECEKTELIGSFRYKREMAKDIDILCTVKDIKGLKGMHIVNGIVQGYPLDIFIEDRKGKQGVFEASKNVSYFREFKKKMEFK